MATTDLHAHITWDSEPTEEAKNFIRVEVLKVLQETFQESSWLTEFVRAEVHKALDQDRRELAQAMGMNRHGPGRELP